MTCPLPTSKLNGTPSAVITSSRIERRCQYRQSLDLYSVTFTKANPCLLTDGIKDGRLSSSSSSKHVLLLVVVGKASLVVAVDCIARQNATSIPHSHIVVAQTIASCWTPYPNLVQSSGSRRVMMGCEGVDRSKKQAHPQQYGCDCEAMREYHLGGTKYAVLPKSSVHKATK